MHSVKKFLRATLTGGILFLLPVVLLVILISKAIQILRNLSAPFQDKMPDIILGFDGSSLVAVLLLILICFFSGLIFRSSRVQHLVERLEGGVLSYVPAYTLLKSVTNDVIGVNSAENLTTVFVRDGEVWNLGFLVEQDGDLCTVFLPEAPKHDSGEVKIVPAAWVKKTSIPTNKVTKSLKQYGKGAIVWMR